METQETNKDINKNRNIIIIVLILLVLAGLVYYTKNKDMSGIDNTIDIGQMPEDVDTGLTEEQKDEINTVVSGIQGKIDAKDCIEKDTTPCFSEYLQLGMNYEAKGELKNAINAYTKASEISPTDYIPYSNIGSIYKGQKDFVRAEQAFKKALTLDPQAVSVYTKMYDMYWHDQKKYPHEIMPFLEDAIKKTNNDFTIVQLYATYLYEVNDLETALPLWESFVTAFPDNASYKQRVEEIKKRIADEKSMQAQ